jgi:hypothetical protein
MLCANHTTILTRARQCLAVAALMAGVALAAPPLAGATPRGFSNCANSSSEIGHFAKCCTDYGGTVETVPATNDSASYKTCTFPPAAQEGSTPPKPEVVTQVAPPPAAPEEPGPVFTPIPMAPNRGVG